MRYHSFFGIDIGKYEFVIGELSCKQTQTFSNDETGWSSFFKNKYKDLKNALVVLETTGGYESGLLNFLIDRNIAVHRADTRKVKSFIRSFGQKAKTDAIDALALAHYGRERCDHLKLFAKADTTQNHLRILEERRQDLKQMLVKEKNRLQAPLSQPIQKSIELTIGFLEQRILEITEMLNAQIEQCPMLTARRTVLQTIPGIGSTTSTSLMALIPELGHLNGKQVASLCGLAPHARQSGTRIWYSKTGHGRGTVKPILFMAAMAARRTKTPLSAFYENLIAKGKSKMVALVAVMRKIIVIANAKMRDQITMETLATPLTK